MPESSKVVPTAGHAPPDAPWTMDDLNVLAVAALAQDKAHDGRWQGVELGRRTIRYYATLGLMDRPSAMLGRKAFYGHRHLVQLVAVKRLQGQGLPLDAIHARLANLTTEALSELAALPAELLDHPEDHAPEERDFHEAWTEAVNEAMQPPDLGPELVNVMLDRAVTLSIATRHPLQPSDIHAIKMAGRFLVDTLRERGLVAAPAIEEAS